MSQQVWCDALHNGSAISIIQATVGNGDAPEGEEVEFPKAAPGPVVAKKAIKREPAVFKRVDSD